VFFYSISGTSLLHQVTDCCLGRSDLYLSPTQRFHIPRPVGARFARVGHAPLQPAL